MVNYSKSVDLRRNELTESTEYPNNSRNKKGFNISTSNINVDSNLSKNLDRKNLNSSQSNYRQPYISAISNFNTRNDHKDRHRLLSYKKSHNFNSKKYSLNLSGSNLNMYNPITPTDRSIPKLQSQKSNDNISEKKLRNIYDSKNNKIPYFHTNPFQSRESNNDINNKERSYRYDCIEVNENKSSDDFSFSNDENSSDVDIKYQFKLIKNRTQAIMNKLNDANKKLIRRVNSIPSFSVDK